MEDNNKDIKKLEEQSEAHLSVLKKANRKVRSTLILNILGTFVILIGMNVAVVFRGAETIGWQFYVIGAVSAIIAGFLWWLAAQRKNEALELLKDFDMNNLDENPTNSDKKTDK